MPRELDRTRPDGGGKGEEFLLRKSFPHFEDRVRNEMRRRRITLDALASRTGLSRPTLRKIVYGRGNPKLGNLLRVAHAIGVPFEQLLGPEHHTDSPATERTDALLAVPPSGPSLAYWIYKQLCQGVEIEEIEAEVRRAHFPGPGESPRDAIWRAVLDVLHYQQAAIRADRLPRDRALEERITAEYELRQCKLLRDPGPVRVLDLPDQAHHLLRILGVASVAADVTKELMQRCHTLGVSDGFASACWQLFLRRGELRHIELLPLVLTPRFTQFELAANVIVASMMRTHFGYRVGSTIEVDDLRGRLREIDHAVVSCGPGADEEFARLPRLIRESDLDYPRVFEDLRTHAVVGDLLYHFLDANGEEVEFSSITGDLSTVDGSTLRATASPPLVYSPPLDHLAEIADRGVTLLQSHQADRAPVVRAALRRRPRPINFLVVTRDLARALVAPHC